MNDMTPAVAGRLQEAPHAKKPGHRTRESFRADCQDHTGATCCCPFCCDYCWTDYNDGGAGVSHGFVPGLASRASPLATFELLSDDDLMGLPPATWLMDHLIPENGLITLYGEPGSGKSFVALDWAMCISQGLPWLEKHKTKQAPVIYIAAEGGRGISKRVREWKRQKGIRSLPGMYYLLSPLYVREEAVVEAFLDLLDAKDLFPGLVVFDTLSQSMGSGDENTNDMSYFVSRVRELANGRFMSALIVHHSNATGARERGHSSLRGNVDTMFSCKAERNGDERIIHLTLTNNKQRDDTNADAIYLQPSEESTHSLVFVEGEPPAKKEKGSGIPGPMRKVDMLVVLGQHADGLTYSEWRLACGIDKNRFNRRRNQMLENSEIIKENGKYYVMPANIDLAVDEEDE